MFNRPFFRSSPEKFAPEIQAQVNKRLALNMLIHGAAAHAFVTASHLAKDKLESISPGLTELYDRFVIANQLNYLVGEIALLFGWPNRLWGFTPWPIPILRHSEFLSRFANQLACESKKDLFERAKDKGLAQNRFAIYVQAVSCVTQVTAIEVGRKSGLTEIAKNLVAAIWEFPKERFDAELTSNPAFGKLQTPRTLRGKFYRKCAVGYSGIQKRDGGLTVVAKARFFPILVHELVKGILELICVHGLNQMDDESYKKVIAVADELEHESWMLQGGAAMWRHFLAVSPRDVTLANNVMNTAMLPPKELDTFLVMMMEEPNRATEMLRDLDE